MEKAYLQHEDCLFEKTKIKARLLCCHLFKETDKMFIINY